MRGTRRDDVRPDLRITNFKKRAVIAFAVEAERVSIIGIYYGGKTTKRFCMSTWTTKRLAGLRYDL